MFHERLKNLRLEKGLTQSDVADAINTSRAAYTNYELGNRLPDYDTLISIAQFFQVTTDFLLGVSKNRYIDSPKSLSHDQIVIDAYKSKPEMQPAVDKLLGIEPLKNFNQPTNKDQDMDTAMELNMLLERDAQDIIKSNHKGQTGNE